jgi:hypothetical protein
VEDVLVPTVRQVKISFKNQGIFVCEVVQAIASVSNTVIAEKRKSKRNVPGVDAAVLIRPPAVILHILPTCQ